LQPDPKRSSITESEIAVGLMTEKMERVAIAQINCEAQLCEMLHSNASLTLLCMPNDWEIHPQRDWATSQLGFGYRLDTTPQSWVGIGTSIEVFERTELQQQSEVQNLLTKGKQKETFSAYR
jgi:hypothetical protein